MGIGLLTLDKFAPFFLEKQPMPSSSFYIVSIRLIALMSTLSPWRHGLPAVCLLKLTKVFSYLCLSQSDSVDLLTNTLQAKVWADAPRLVTELDEVFPLQMA